AGSSCQSTIETARATNNLAIGVNYDQNHEAPGHVLTSMVKAVNIATFDVIQRVQNHTFKGGIYSFGLKEGGVGYIYDDRNLALIPDSAHARVEELRQEIIAGRIKVPSTRCGRREAGGGRRVNGPKIWIRSAVPPWRLP